VELSTARYEQEQSGRLVGGAFPNDSVPIRLDCMTPLLSGLIGYAWSARATRVVILGGLSAKLDEPTIDGEPREPFDVEGEERLRFVPTGGADLLKSLNSRTALIVGGRYSFVDRPRTTATSASAGTSCVSRRRSRADQLVASRPQLLGVPYDASSSYLRGSAAAPPLIRQAMRSPAGNQYTERGADLSKLADAGD
jgi:hypothetical protein